MKTKEIYQLAFPAIVSGIAEPVLSLIDTAVIGAIPKDTAAGMAAVGLAASLITTIVWVLAQIKTALTATVSHAVGAKNIKSVSNLPFQLFVAVCVISVAIICITLAFDEVLFSWYHAEGKVLEMCLKYYRIRIFGLPFILSVFLFFGVQMGLQNTLVPMKISLIGAVCNVFLDVVLVFGIPNFIAPLGIEGAAWATLIAQLVMFFFSVYYFFRLKSFAKRTGNKRHPLFFKIWWMSFNLFLRSICLNFTLFLSNRYAALYGNQAVAAHHMAFQIWLFFSFLIDGFAGVGSMVAGKLKGQIKLNELPKLVNKLIRSSILVAVIITVVLGVFYNWLGLVFTRDQLVIDQFNSILWVVLLMQPVNAIAFVYDDVFKGLSEVIVLRNVLFVSTFLVFLPAVLIFDFYQWGLLGIWFAFYTWMLARGILLWRLFNKKIILNYG